LEIRDDGDAADIECLLADRFVAHGGFDLARPVTRRPRFYFDRCNELRMRHDASKRGSGERAILPDDAVASVPGSNINVLALDEALGRLAHIDSQQSRVVELRFFGGLTIKETAEVIGVSPATVEREWTVAKAWLYDQLGRTTP
jgi:DNA-directed RNA polymerase specialized sigma24 family protein